MRCIHPTAIVEDGARVGADVTVGAFSVIGRNVVIEDGVTVDSHVIVSGRTTIGARTRISPFAAIGGEAQDLSSVGEDTAIVIGRDCVVREHVTIHLGTKRGRGTTTIGAHCFLMIGSHVAHDCTVGDHAILTNEAVLGGHAEIGAYAILGGLAAVQQRQRIGAHAFVGGQTGVRCDVVPFVMAVGNHAQLAGINVIGLRRRGFGRDVIHSLRAAYRTFFMTGGPRAERLARVADKFVGIPAVDAFVAFIRDGGDRPLTLPRAPGSHDHADQA